MSNEKQELIRKMTRKIKQASAWDNSDDWAFAADKGVQRDILPDFKFKPSSAKVLAKCLRSTMMALGHSMTAYTRFTKLKSVEVSPDGSLGGRGYSKDVMEMRRLYANVVEALSSLSDTLYDELNAPHWEKLQDKLDPKDKKEVSDIIKNIDEINEDPKAWAAEEEEEEFGETDDEIDLSDEEEEELEEEIQTEIEEELSTKEAEIEEEFQHEDNFKSERELALEEEEDDEEEDDEEEEVKPKAKKKTKKASTLFLSLDAFRSEFYK